ncbi:MAG: hypothetical protein L0H93_08285, partial [Nocardioides sp.]|nr:hypothetical protein [Nocardioides sp.]
RGRDGRHGVVGATLTVRGGRSDDLGWPSVDDLDHVQSASSHVVAHPFDDRVLLGTHRARNHGATAAVSAGRVGRQQACLDGASVVVESRLMDHEDPAANSNLHFTLWDAADAVRGLRREGHTVFLHCVAAEQRTPSIAIAYAVLLGKDIGVARDAVRNALPSTRAHGRVWDAVADLE